jgi:Bacterial SH3 domain
MKTISFLFLTLIASCSFCFAQTYPPNTSFYYVANTRPPDAYLSLRTEPTTGRGMNIMTMPNGTLLDLIERRSDRWWHVRVFPTGQEGWALSGQGNKVWIECCLTAQGTPAVDENQQAPVGFKTPSNNIYCQFAEGVYGDFPSSVRCDIKESYGPLPPRPADCDLEWRGAYTISQEDRSGQLICHGDTVIDDALPTLSYGQSWRRGGLRCKSESTGVTCINALGHGFFISRESQRLY